MGERLPSNGARVPVEDQRALGTWERFWAWWTPFKTGVIAISTVIAVVAGAVWAAARHLDSFAKKVEVEKSVEVIEKKVAAVAGDAKEYGKAIPRLETAVEYLKLNLYIMGRHAGAPVAPPTMAPPLAPAFDGGPGGAP